MWQGFWVSTDNKPLWEIFGPQPNVHALTVAHLQRWKMLLSDYQFNTVHNKVTRYHTCMLSVGCQYQEVGAAVFSVWILDCEPLSAADLAKETMTALVLQKVLQYTLRYTLHGRPDVCMDDTLEPLKRQWWELLSKNVCLLLWMSDCASSFASRNKLYEITS